MNGIPLNSIELNGKSENSMRPTKVNVIEWNISKFNVIMNGNPLSAMELNGTSVNKKL